MTTAETDPDARGAALVAGPLPAARYTGGDVDAHECTGLLFDLVPESARVLDVGCGTGSFCTLMRDRRNAEVIGIEPQRERAAIASQRGIEVVNAGFDHASVEGLGRFDVIVFADVLEHLVDPGEALRLARSILRPGGFVIASVPNVAHWSVRVSLMRGRFDYQALGIMDATHLRWFTRSSLDRLFERSGYRVLSSQPTAGTWMPDYHNRRPWKWFAADRRNRFVRKAAKRWPELFGCQFVVKAMPVDDHAEKDAA